MSDVVTYASVLHLTRFDIQVLSIRDPYSLHKVVFGLFENVRSESEKKTSFPSGILYADNGVDNQVRKVLIVSDRKPHQTPQFGKIETKTVSSEILSFDRYRFEVAVNPGKRDIRTGKIVPIRSREAISEWFKERALNSWGFSVIPESLQVGRIIVQTFEKSGQTITQGNATVSGELVVTARTLFLSSFRKGIGRGRAFGLGLLKIVPIRG